MCKPSAAADVVAVTAGLLLVDPFVSLSRSSHDGCGPPGFGSGLGLGGWSTGCHIFTWFWKSHIILTDSYGCRSIQVAVMIMRMMIIMVMMMTRLMTFCTKNVFWSLHKGLFTWHIVISLAVSEPCGLSPWSSADLCQNDDHDIVTMTVWPVGPVGRPTPLRVSPTLSHSICPSAHMVLYSWNIGTFSAPRYYVRHLPFAQMHVTAPINSEYSSACADTLIFDDNWKKSFANLGNLALNQSPAHALPWESSIPVIEYVCLWMKGFWIYIFVNCQCSKIPSSLVSCP